MALAKHLAKWRRDFKTLRGREPQYDDMPEGIRRIEEAYLYIGYKCVPSSCLSKRPDSHCELGLCRLTAVPSPKPPTLQVDEHGLNRTPPRQSSRRDCNAASMSPSSTSTLRLLCILFIMLPGYSPPVDVGSFGQTSN